MGNDFDTITARVVRADETQSVFELLEEAAVWLRDHSIDYWQCWHSPPDGHARWIMEGIRAGEFRFVEIGSELIGMFRLQWADALFWSGYDAVHGSSGTADSGYVHSFVTKRQFAGMGLGYAILRLVEKMCVRNGKTRLRLDCGEQIAGLHRYYEGFGFTRVGSVNVFGETLVLFEKPIDSIRV